MTYLEQGLKIVEEMKEKKKRIVHQPHYKAMYLLQKEKVDCLQVELDRLRLAYRYPIYRTWWTAIKRWLVGE